jgi:phenylpropionate dioxygenase-like ring-hydroxylating dioxygenase large terminal subunit/AcrR family transcriptional regulator
VASEGAPKAHTDPAPPPAPERASRTRQRQRLIDACISALHIYGPSHTTVERVVALADMSPGIVRFYFESKAAMLVASLEFLATEFEQRVQLPVERLKDTPVQALEQLVELYLDPDIASPRKVSVWYCFWGEASARQEYLEICGHRDEDFEVLVRELIGRMIEHSGERQLDADAIALGLMGVLEVLWQGIAFQTEDNIDRGAARRRAMNYLRSVFPRHFGPAVASRDAPGNATLESLAVSRTPARLPAWAYSDSALYVAEREQLFRNAWQIAGHASELARAGAYLAMDLPTERALLLRDEAGVLRAFHNTCRHRPHALLTTRSGTLDGSIECAVHALQYGYDGKRRRGATPGDLMPLECAEWGGWILVRPVGGPPEREASSISETLSAWSDAAALAAPRAHAVSELEIAADWKLVIEQWLESALAQHPVGTLGELLQTPVLHRLDPLTTIDWRAGLRANAPGWTAGHYARLAQRVNAPIWERLFLHPNQLLEMRPDGALLLQVMPLAPGRCRLRQLVFQRRDAGAVEQALAFLAQRLTAHRINQDVELARSIQAGLEGSQYAAPEDGPVPAALAAFRRAVLMLLPSA